MSLLSLLWSEQSDREDCEASGIPFVSAHYPDGYEVALDVVTGVVVQLEPVGGGGVDPGFSLTIHGVDDDLDDVFVGRSRRR